jgi:ribosomal protein S18 acetylase RimI-like enzyme
VTDLGVEPAYRERGIGKLLLARAGQQSAKSKVTLAAQDNGSGRLMGWYKGMGLAQVGRNERGYPSFEAPIS